MVNRGFNRSATASSPGDFTLRGEILDIVISEDTGYRLNFAWNKIETIKCFDPLTQVSRSQTHNISLHPTSEFNLRPENISRFKEGFVRNFGVNHINHPLYLSVLEARHFASAEHLLPLLYEEMTCITDYLENPSIMMDQFAKHAMEASERDVLDLHQSRIDGNKASGHFYPVLNVNELYFHETEAKDKLSLSKVVDSGIDDKTSGENVIISAPNFYHQSLQNQQAVLSLFDEFQQSHKNTPITICCPSKSGIERVRNILELYGFNNLKDQARDQVLDSPPQNPVTKTGDRAIILATIPLQSGFVTKEHIFLSQYDLLGAKSTQPSRDSNKKLKTLLSEIENLAEGALIAHKDHGIGKFIGIETIEVAGIPHDCVKLLYADNDRIYIPVENLDSIKRYGSDEAELDKLGGVSWQKRKSKLKNRIGELAVKLMQIAAERRVRKVEHIIPTESYEQFAAKFPYSETDDQLNAIEDIKEDFIKGYPMDRLICGDVGFGKTEVAMRAAFLAASNGKQVVVIAPTTILCRQHYTSFVERFCGSGLNIAQISRLVSSGEVNRVKAALRAGEINIAIGTHAILAKDVGFHDLGLMILDEEQHFGVAQKERMKELQRGVHALSLSATPIPRTLQMSLLGIRDLSLIATPPIDRLAVRTAVIPYDPVIIRDALLKERMRGGRSFYVCPRIKDIEDIAKKLTSIVPELTYQIAHGQMAPNAIDQIMGDFYDGKFDILLSTTIIESGIDVPSANTMIIHKAEMLGLSQLYQLRGRVGRSKLRGYAYLTMSAKSATKHALQRLEIMQNLDSLGAGFSIASHDMDIRGFGNLVGDEQSGHIREVGVELYQDMLEAAICELKDQEPEQSDLNPSINIGIAVSLPEGYIGDNNLRIGLYKRISILDTEEQIEDFKDELIDRFGPMPQEVINLLSIIHIKQLCRKLHIQNLDSGPQGFVIKFQEGYDAVEMVMKFINKYPRHSKIRPDGKFVVLRALSPETIVSVACKLLSELSEI